MTTEIPSPARSDSWDLAGKAVALFAVLLPVIGAGVRWVSFQFDPSVPSEIAFARPVAALAADGFTTLLFAAPLSVLTWLVYRQSVPWRLALTELAQQRRAARGRTASKTDELKAMSGRWEERTHRIDALRTRGEEVLQRTNALADMEPTEAAKAREEIIQETQKLQADLAAETAEVAELGRTAENLESEAEAAIKELEEIRKSSDSLPKLLPMPLRLLHRLDRRWRLLILILGSVAIVVLGPGIPLIWPLALVYWFVYAWFDRIIDRTRGLRFVAALPPLLVLALGSAVTFGLLPRTPPTAAYVFDGASVESGLYGVLGETEHFLYLTPCESRGPVVAVPIQTVRSVEYGDRRPNPAPPSLLDIVQRGVPIRFGLDRSC